MPVGARVITRVHIRRYKSPADVEVKLQPLSVLFGPNAAGKSTFLDALQLLSAMVAPRQPLRAAFEAPHRGQALESFAFAAGGVSELLGKASATFEIEVDLRLSAQTVEFVNRQVADLRHAVPGEADDPKRLAVVYRDLRYRVVVEMMSKRSASVRIKDDYLAALKKDGTPTRSRSPFIESKGTYLALRVEGQGHPVHHQVGLDYTLLSMSLYPPHYPHVVAAQRELTSWAFFYFEPRERMGQPNPIKEVRQIGAMGEDLAAYLHTLRAEDPAARGTLNGSGSSATPPERWSIG